MKKYIPIDFDEKGNAVLGNAKSNPTSNGFIPTTWAPGGSDEGKQGLKSITISPALETTPALDSLFPIYYEDLTEDQKYDGVSLTITTGSVTPGTDYTVTATPTSGWYIVVFGNRFSDDPTYVGEPNEVVEIASITANSHGEVTGKLYIGVATGTPRESDMVMFKATISMTS